jgi:E3 ubiquitin-protein ligase LRSAM1
MPFGLFGKKSGKSVDYKSRLEHKLYLARENPEPVFDLSDCGLKLVPSGIYSLCRVFRKEALYLQENQLTSLVGGGNLCDLSMLEILDLHSNCFVRLPDEIGHLRNLQVLNVSSNRLKLLPDSIGQLERLRVLNASSNHLKALPDSIGNLKCLQHLDLHDNQHLKVLPAALAQATRLKEITLDSVRFTYPPEEIAVQGVIAIMEFLSKELGVEHVSKPDTTGDSPVASHSSGVTDWEEKDRDFQEQKQQELLMLERNIEEQQKKEVELQTAKKSDAGRLLEDLMEQQSKLETEVLQIQRKREAERMSFVKQLQEVEENVNSVISQLLAMNALSDSRQLQHLLEMENREEQQLLNVAQAKYQSYQRKDVISAMEAILEEECHRERKLREYEEGRAEVTRTLLSQQVESDQQLENILGAQGQIKSELMGRLQKDEELQCAAVGALLERSDARSWGLVHQVSLVESQLAALTAVEMERKKLQMSEQVEDLSQKRVALSILLMDLLSQQAERRRQLLNTLTEMEKRRWVEEEGQSKDGDFWLRQYQRLLDSRPTCFVEMDQMLDPLLAHHLVAAGVIHCLPFLARWSQSKQALEDVTDSMLQQAGLTESEMRTAVLKAVRLYLDERAAAGKSENERPRTLGTDLRPQPSAPPASLQTPGTDFRPQPSAPPTEGEEEECGSAHNIAVAECVVCMDRKCEVILVPCGHMCCCIKCVDMVTACPMCRGTIEKKVRVILP